MRRHRKSVLGMTSAPARAASPGYALGVRAAAAGFPPPT